MVFISHKKGRPPKGTARFVGGINPLVIAVYPILSCQRASMPKYYRYNLGIDLGIAAIGRALVLTDDAAHHQGS